MLWGIKLVGKKVWNCANKWNFERWHGTWFWKNVYSLWVNCCYGMPFLFSIYIDVYYLILEFSLFSPMDIHSFQFFFNVCRWKMKKKKTINIVNTTFLKITQVMEVALAVTAVEVKKDDHYVIWISKQGILFFEICLWNQTFCLM